MPLRWLLGVPAALFAVGWIAFGIGADSFRRSFGASENALWKSVLPVTVALLFVASVAWPDRRWLMHLTALSALALLLGSVYIARESIVTAAFGTIYSVGWLVFYWRAVW